MKLFIGHVDFKTDICGGILGDFGLLMIENVIDWGVGGFGGKNHTLIYPL